MIETPEQFREMLKEMNGYKKEWMYDVIEKHYVIAFYGKEPSRRVIVSEALASEVRRLNK
jgi:hypothetical protein